VAELAKQKMCNVQEIEITQKKPSWPRCPGKVGGGNRGERDMAVAMEGRERGSGKMALFPRGDRRGEGESRVLEAWR